MNSSSYDAKSVEKKYFERCLDRALPMPRRVRRLLLVGILFGTLPVRLSAQELLRVPYGVTTSLQHLPVLVGKDSGLFAR